MKKNFILYLTILILIPIFVVSIIYKSLLNDKTIEVEKNNTTTQKSKTSLKIKINKHNKIVELDLEEYIIGVVAGEMPASFNVEALKAQAVASRTYALYKIENNKDKYDIKTTIDDQVYIDKPQMKAKWDSDYELYYNKIKKAVEETKNIVMKKNNEIFKAYYFAMSNGYTEDSITVFGDTTTKSVSSPWDNNSLNKFEVSTTFNKEDIEEKLELNESINNIEIIKKDKNNRVEEIKVNNKTYSGIEFRKLLSLRSTDFTISMKDNDYIITTKGYGHGVGMSQYGANGMAKEKKNYKEILEYYYQDIEFKEI